MRTTSEPRALSLAQESTHVIHSVVVERRDDMYPFLMLEATLAILKGDSHDAVIAAAIPQLQVLATKADVEIKVRSANVNQTLEP